MPLLLDLVYHIKSGLPRAGRFLFHILLLYWPVVPVPASLVGVACSSCCNSCALKPWSAAGCIASSMLTKRLRSVYRRIASARAPVRRKKPSPTGDFQLHQDLCVFSMYI